jgi:imidazolonepropionase-like amidohydrolase
VTTASSPSVRVASVTIPRGRASFDVSGKVVMPGMVDTHYHPQWLTPQIHNTQTWQYLATLAYGTTTTRDPQTATTDFLAMAIAWRTAR